MDSGKRDWGFEKYLKDSGVFNSQPHTVHDEYYAVWKAAQQSMYQTALRRGLAWAFWGLVTLLSILYLIFGGW